MITKLISYQFAWRVMLLSLCACATNVQANTSQPNIIFILADDLGFGDIGKYGRPDYETPTLDSLADEGLMLTNAYANSAVCSPTRTALLTGRYQYRYRVGLEEPLGKFDDLGIPENELTIARAFKSAGYSTGLIGKWHLGYAPEHTPRESGYEHFFGFFPGGIDYFEHKVYHGKVKIPGFKAPPQDGLWRSTPDGHEPVAVSGYATDIFAKEAQAIIKQFSEQNNPFFLSLHFNSPHWPWEGPNDVLRSKELTTIFDNDGGNFATYGAMVNSLDNNISNILGTLEELGLEENTIVVFTSDNGGERFSYNWPFLGKKGELLEGGIRVPAIIKWPKAIEAGTISDQVLISMDWMPTLLAAAGVNSDEVSGSDGQNLFSVLSGKEDTKQRTLFWRFKNNAQRAVRDGDWKYLTIGEKEYLFDLSVDKREQANLVRKFPAKAAELRAKYAQWNERMMPYPEDSFSSGVKLIYSDRY